MKRESVKMMMLGFFVLALAIGAAIARAADAKDPYPSMASPDQYLIADRGRNRIGPDRRPVVRFSGCDRRGPGVARL